MLETSDIVVPEDVLKKLKEDLKKKTEQWSVGICAGLIRDIEGHDTHNHTHTACHSWLTGAFYNYAPRPEKGLPFFALNCYKFERSGCSKSAHKAAILWLAQESCFSRYIVNRDDVDSLTNDGAIILCGPGGASQNEALWICKFMRHATEGQQSLNTWEVLYKGGVNPYFAVWLCSYLATSKNKLYNNYPVTGHTKVFDYFNLRSYPDFTKLLKGEANHIAGSTHSVFGEIVPKDPYKADPNHPLTRISNFCTPFVKSDGWGGTIQYTGISEKDLIKEALLWQAELEGRSVEPYRPSKTTEYLELDM